MAATLPTVRTTIMDGAGNEAEIDDVGQALIGIDFAHHEIHEGNHYFVSGYTEKDTSETMAFALTTNATAHVHMTWSIAASLKTNVKVYEGSTVTGGTAVIPYNSNRNSSNTSTVTLVSNPTVSGTGTLIASSGFGAVGNKLSSFGGSTDRESEIILKTSTCYRWLITSEDDNNVLDYIGSWYELE